MKSKKILSILISVMLLTASGVGALAYSNKGSKDKKGENYKISFSYPDMTIELFAALSDVVVKIKVNKINDINNKDKDYYTKDIIKKFAKKKQENSKKTNGEPIEDKPATIDVVGGINFDVSMVNASITYIYKDNIGLDKDISIYIPAGVIEGYDDTFIEEGLEYVVLLNATSSGLLKLVAYHIGMIEYNGEKSSKSIIGASNFKEEDLISWIEAYYSK